MDTLYPRCAGVDLHKKNVVVCVCCVFEGGRLTKQVRTFSTIRRNLLVLVDWLTER
jgi:transposase